MNIQQLHVAMLILAL